jgi:hypothetical protein
MPFCHFSALPFIKPAFSSVASVIATETSTLQEAGQWFDPYFIGVR